MEIPVGCCCFSQGKHCPHPDPKINIAYLCRSWTLRIKACYKWHAPQKGNGTVSLYNITRTLHKQLSFYMLVQSSAKQISSQPLWHWQCMVIASDEMVNGWQNIKKPRAFATRQGTTFTQFHNKSYYYTFLQCAVNIGLAGYHNASCQYAPCLCEAKDTTFMVNFQSPVHRTASSVFKVSLLSHRSPSTHTSQLQCSLSEYHTPHSIIALRRYPSLLVNLWEGYKSGRCVVYDPLFSQISHVTSS